MTTIFLFFNAFFTWYFWKKSQEAFEEERRVVGWIDLFMSALNFAVLMDHFWK